MKTGLLIIATEILEGKIHDTNGRFLSDFLGEHHLELFTALTVRDTEVEIQRGLEYLLRECALVITSGGLGPTKDDLTKEAVGKFLERKNTYSPEAENVAFENYRRLGRPFPGKEHPYSFLPEGFVPLSNPTGFAPGLFCENKGRYLFCAPGVPREFKSILQGHLAPWLERTWARDLVMENVIIRTRRVPEEKIFGELDKDLWEKLSEFGDPSSLPVLMGVNIGVKIKAKNQDELEAKKSGLIRVIESSPARSCVWHWGQEKLEEVIVAMANSQRITFGFAESCTGGLCSHRITGVPGSSQGFMGSVISYDNSVKEDILDVPGKIIEEHGVVSTQTAEAMALGLLNKLNLDIAISTTGIAGPTGGSEDIPVGTVCVGICIQGKTASQRFQFRGERELLKERFCEAALMLLLESMENFA